MLGELALGNDGLTQQRSRWNEYAAKGKASHSILVQCYVVASARRARYPHFLNNGAADPVCSFGPEGVNRNYDQTECD